MTDNVVTPTFGDAQDFDPDAGARPPEFSDDALALRFTKKYKNDIRFVKGWGRWLLWDGRRWQVDETLRVFDLVRAVCRSAAAKCVEFRPSRAVASAKAVAAVERLARADRHHAATVEQWDRDPWLLNVPKAVVDFRAGEVRPHRRDDYLTKICAVSPEGDCPTWLRFLERVTGGDVDLLAFLQRMAGYCLTGITCEHALFFLHGTGANGKSVFINTISGIIGDYAAVAPTETFYATKAERHPTDLAGLRGARLVTAVETEEGRWWAEAKIKRMTGGDPIPARFMRQDFFTFTPEFKLVITGNHKPSIRTIDEAMRRRFNLIPFAVTIPKDERDESLPDRLKKEWPGILKWMVAGCLEWQKTGLAPPPVVNDATAEYLAAEDSIGQWIDERYVAGAAYTATSQDLFASWKEWCAVAGEEPGSKKAMSQKLSA